MSTLTVYRLGRVEYEDGLALMERFGAARREGLVGDTLLLLEHPPVLTLGRAAKRENVLASDALLAKHGVRLFETNRGGDVTYHGPGQIVGYPIILLPKERQDVRRYVRDVERCVIDALALWGLESRTIPKWPGVWLGTEPSDAGPGDARKVAAIGVHLSRWLTSHGFALNVNTNLSHFDLIVPCGIREAGVTSMQKELRREVPVAQVEDQLAANFLRVFDAEPGVPMAPLRTVSVAVVRGVGEGARVLLLQRTPGRGGFWQTVTGRIEDGETPAQAAARELREETGLEGSVTDLGYVHGFALGDVVPPRLVQEHGFAVRLPAGDDRPVRLGAEHREHAWVDVPTALQQLPFEGLREAVRRAVAP